MWTARETIVRLVVARRGCSDGSAGAVSVAAAGGEDERGLGEAARRPASAAACLRVRVATRPCTLVGMRRRLVRGRLVGGRAVGTRERRAKQARMLSIATVVRSTSGRLRPFRHATHVSPWWRNDKFRKICEHRIRIVVSLPLAHIFRRYLWRDFRPIGE